MDCSFDIDVSDLERDNTIYSISVPINSDYLKGADTQKTNSRLLINTDKVAPLGDSETDVSVSERKSDVSENTDSLESVSLKVSDAVLMKDGNFAIFSGGKLSILNSSGKVIKESDVSISFAQKSTAVLKVGGDKIIVTNTERKGEDTNITAYIFDTELNLINRVDLDSVFKESNIFSPSIGGVSSDGKNILVLSADKIFSLDISTLKMTAVLDGANDNIINAFYNAEFCNGDKSIAFYGDEKESGAHKSLYGIANAGGSGLKYFVQNNVDSQIQIFDKGAFFDDSNVAKGDFSSGKAYGVDFLGNNKEYKFVDLNESQHAVISSDGARVATYLEFDDKYKFRVYNSADMNLIKEIDVPITMTTTRIRYSGFFISNDGSKIYAFYEAGRGGETHLNTYSVIA